MGRLCVSLREKSWEAFRASIQKVSVEVDMVELRLDDLEDMNIPKIEHVHILTLGSRYQNEPGLRWEVWQKLHALQTPWIDLAWEEREWFSGALVDWDRIVLSYHHKGGVLDIEKLLAEMKMYPAAKIKIVIPTNSVVDSLRMLLLQKREGSRFIGICSGYEGEVTRLLSPLFGGDWMYASLDAEHAVAPGQIPWKEMKERFHFQKLNLDSFVIGVIGFPVEHSKGIIFHNAVIKELGLNGVFVRISLHEEELSDFFGLVQQLPFKGLAVTMPLKEKVLSFLDDRDDVNAIGACNTLSFEKGKVKGVNTDGVGALNAIEKRGAVLGKTIWIIGAGGAAKAIAVEAVRRGAKVCIFNRNVERARDFSQYVSCEAYPLDSLHGGGYDVLINATSVGMKGQPQERIIEMDQLCPGKIVLDIVTMPQETLLLREAKARGCTTITGTEMVVLQGVEQWKLWFPEIDEKKVEEAMNRAMSF